jgi:hypothetical protein
VQQPSSRILLTVALLSGAFLAEGFLQEKPW